MLLLRRFFFCALLLLSAAPALRAGDDVLVSRPGVLHVDLPTAVRMALKKNFSIQVQEFEPRISRERLTSEWGIFDPEFSIGSSRDYTRSQNRVLAADQRATSRFTSRRDVPFETALSGLTPLGTDYRFGLSAVNATGTSQPFDEFATGPTFSLSQPLLRGFGPSATMNQIRIARTNVEISEWALRERVINVVTELIYVYNDLHFDQQDLQVAVRSRELARRLLHDNSERARIGVMSPFDVIPARAQVAQREEAVILAGRKMATDELLLKQLITDELEPMLAIRLEIDPPPFHDLRMNVHTGIREALELRPDYQSLLLNLRNRHVTIAFAKNQALPQLDLNASLGFLGFDSDFINSIGRSTRADRLSWSAGAVFSIPLGNHSARGTLNAARLEAAKVLIDLKRLEQQIVVDVDLAAGEIVSDRARIASTTEASGLAKESLDAGEQRLKAGTGTTFEVLELQKQLAEAESAELRARADHSKAVAEFYRKTARTLREHHIDLD